MQTKQDYINLIVEDLNNMTLDEVGELQQKLNFLKNISMKFDIEDFTGHLGVVLDDNCEDKQAINSGLNFLNELYEIAVKELE